MADNQWGIIAAMLVMVATYLLSIQLPQYPWLIAGAAAALYAISTYLKKLAGSTPESFDWPKFIGTLLVGFVIGAILYNLGTPVSEQEIYVQIGIYTGLIALAENVVRAVIRWAFQGRAPARGA